MNRYQQELMDKIDDLRQQARFCMNNYDYHHQNNESAIMDRKWKKLHSSANSFNTFWSNLEDVERTIEEMSAECDKVDALLSKYGIRANCIKSQDKQENEIPQNDCVEEQDAESEKENS